MAQEALALNLVVAKEKIDNSFTIENISEINTLFNEYNFLGYVFSWKMKGRCNYNEKSLLLLSVIRDWPGFGDENKKYYLTRLKDLGASSVDEVGGDLNKFKEDFYDVCLKDQPYLNYELAILLGFTDINNVPNKITKKINTKKTKSTEKIEIGARKNWSLCSSSESRLITSMERGDTILVNNNLLVKFEGRMTALCLETFTNKDGFTFLAGIWYSPSDSTTRKKLKDDFENGLLEVTVSGGEWAIARGLESRYVNGKTQEVQEALDNAKKYAKDSSKKKLTGNDKDERNERVRREDWRY